MAYKFQLGASTMSGSLVQEGALECETSLTIGSAALTEAELEKLDGITNGTAAADKCLVADSNVDITGLRNITGTGAITAGTSFIIGSADLNETDLEKLDGITDGTAAASKAVVLDASKNIATIGTIGCGAITSTGNSSFGQGSFSAGVIPSSADGAALGSAAKEWSDLYLADGGIVYLGNDQEVQLIHTADSGIVLQNAADGAASAAMLKLQLSSSSPADDDEIGKLVFSGYNDNQQTFVGGQILGKVTAVADGSEDMSMALSTIVNGTPVSFIDIHGTTAATVTFVDGAYDVDIASHDGSNGLKLGGTLVTATASEMNYSDLTTLGTSEASKVLSADASGDITIAGAAANMVWDKSEDALEFADNASIEIGTGLDMKLYHDGTNSYITNASGSLKIATETSGIAVTIGHGTSEVTVADNLTVSGDLTVNGTTTTVDIEVIQTANGVVFEGATADAYETTLKAVDPTGADKTIQLANASGYLIPFAAASTTTISSTPAELNVLDGISGLVVADLNVIAGCAGNGLVIADLTKLAGVDASATELNYNDITTLGSSEASKVLTADASGDITIVGAAANMVWDKSADALEFADNASAEFGTSLDMKIYHDGTNSYIANAVGALKLATETSGIAVTIGHSTSEVTVADNLTVTGDLTVNGGFSSTVTIASGSNGATLSEGKLTYFDNINAAASASFPQNPSVGDWFEVKHHSMGSATNKMTLSVQSGQTCDGGTEVVLESPFAAIKCVYVVTGSWRIL